MAGKFKFSFGPWNIHEGADVFGPRVRKSIEFDNKLELYKSLGFDGIQFHDDDAVPQIGDKTASQIASISKTLKTKLNALGLEAEFVAPRLWEDPRTIDGGFTSNDPHCREYALNRAKVSVDIARELGTDLIVLWLAREGTDLREAKDSKASTMRLAEALNTLLEYDPEIRICIEPKPNEPPDQTYIPTAGHAIALGMLTTDPDRIGVLIESAHSILAGLDPSDDMGFALAHNKLWSVHLNDQNGLKYDQDRTFGSINLRRAFNQIRILDRHDYGNNGEWIGLDVKAIRTQKDDVATRHLSNSREIFLRLLEISRNIDEEKFQESIANRDYEMLDLLIIRSLLHSNS